jgi:transposase-like protein
MGLALIALMSSTNVSSTNKAAARAEDPCPPPVTCPNCGKDTPAASNRSDGVVSYRCDVCGHQWTSAPSPAAAGQKPTPRDSDSELPPIPAIDAPGG